jgi:uncharacterized protein GlcG (DUF336 family)
MSRRRLLITFPGGGTLNVGNRIAGAVDVAECVVGQDDEVRRAAAS